MADLAEFLRQHVGTTGCWWTLAICVPAWIIVTMMIRARNGGRP
jgi:hypothetical protein